MKQLRLMCLAVVMLLVVSANIYAGDRPNLIYVAVDGSDNNPGSSDKPVASLAKAKELARKLQKTELLEPIEVIVGGGIYYLDKTLTFTPQDSGSRNYPITYRAAKGQKVILRGGKKVLGWEKWRDGIYKADLKKQGLKGISFHQLFYKSPSSGPTDFTKRQILARFPNFDPLHPRTGGNLYNKAEAPEYWRQLVYYEGDIPWDNWSDISQAEVVSTYNRGWMFAITPVTDIDKENNIISVRPVRKSEGAKEKGRGEFLKLNRYFIQNVLDALDSPGEWYLDRKESELYFYPPDKDFAKAEVIVPVIDHIIELEGEIAYPYGYLNSKYEGRPEDFPIPDDAPAMNPVEHLIFDGLDLECARQDAVRMVGARYCQVIKSRISNVGNIGVNLGGVTSSYEEVGNPRITPATGHGLIGAGAAGQVLLANDPTIGCKVIGCDIWEVGCEGIMLFGTDNLAENNHIYDIGLYSKDCPAISLTGEGNAARRNTIHDLPRCAIFFKGLDSLIELNDIHHIILESKDMGAIRSVHRNIYLGGDMIRYNRISDAPGYGIGYGAKTNPAFTSPCISFGIYLDDWTSNVTMFGNIISKVGLIGIQIHGGGNNLVTNNIIYDVSSAQVNISNIERWSPWTKSNRSEIFQHAAKNNIIKKNILVSKKKKSVPYKFMRPDKWGGHRASFLNNIIYNSADNPPAVCLLAGTALHWNQWQEMGMEQGSILADPQFVDEAGGDFRLKDTSPAWALGFKRIPVEKIGCYEDEHRVSWPITPNHDRFREKPVLHKSPDYKPKKSKAPAGLKFIDISKIGEIGW